MRIREKKNVRQKAVSALFVLLALALTLASVPTISMAGEASVLAGEELPDAGAPLAGSKAILPAGSPGAGLPAANAAAEAEAAEAATAAEAGGEAAEAATGAEAGGEAAKATKATKAAKAAKAPDAAAEVETFAAAVPEEKGIDLLAGASVAVDNAYDLMNAVANGAATEIRLAPGEYQLVKQPQTVFLYADRGYLEVKRSISFVSDGDGATIKNVAGRRHMYVYAENESPGNPAAINLSFNNVSLVGNEGGGIQSGLYGTLALDGAVITGCTANDDGWTVGIDIPKGFPGILNGGAVCAASGSVALDRCALTDNTTRYGAGGAVYANRSVTAANCAMNGNRALGDSIATGGAVSAMHGDIAYIGGEMKGNYAEMQGGALSHTYNVEGAVQRSVTLKNVAISGNTAVGPCGGVAALTNNGLTVENCTIEENKTNGGSGGGVYILAGDASILDSKISGNSAMMGGGICVVNGNGNIAVSNTLVDGNTADSYGGGLYFGNAGANTLTKTAVSGNTANGNGTYDGGGGLYVGYGATASVSDSTVSGNTASGNGGGLYAHQSATATVSGSAVSGNTANGNGATDGGG
ncbi:MAG: hypothetical protein LBS91_06255, partial [Clostridiales Family XIII bacterium]|nr:hypothetical protein [Clostridiales Family XIII bacterium]